MALAAGITRVDDDRAHYIPIKKNGARITGMSFRKPQDPTSLLSNAKLYHFRLFSGRLIQNQTTLVSFVYPFICLMLRITKNSTITAESLEGHCLATAAGSYRGLSQHELNARMHVISKD
jgi:hypothetical protein